MADYFKPKLTAGHTTLFFSKDIEVPPNGERCIRRNFRSKNQALDFVFGCFEIHCYNMIDVDSFDQPFHKFGDKAGLTVGYG